VIFEISPCAVTGEPPVAARRYVSLAGTIIVKLEIRGEFINRQESSAAKPQRTQLNGSGGFK
jgi:hypothetical protein